VNPVLKGLAFRFSTLEIKLIRSSFYFISSWLVASSITHIIVPSAKSSGLGMIRYGSKCATSIADELVSLCLATQPNDSATHGAKGAFVSVEMHQEPKGRQFN
jgi:hypothetical protein